MTGLLEHCTTPLDLPCRLLASRAPALQGVRKEERRWRRENYGESCLASKPRSEKSPGQPNACRGQEGLTPTRCQLVGARQPPSLATPRAAVKVGHPGNPYPQSLVGLPIRADGPGTRRQRCSGAHRRVRVVSQIARTRGQSAEHAGEIGKVHTEFGHPQRSSR